jgi:hypothetical protein
MDSIEQFSYLLFLKRLWDIPTNQNCLDSMEVREHLTVVLDNLSDDLVAKVRDFAEFLQQRQQK